MKKISIIIPVYNEEDTLSIAYKRIKKTTEEMKNYSSEILFVNDGSQDKTLEMLEEIARKRQTSKSTIIFSKFWTSMCRNSGTKECHRRCCCYYGC